VWTDDIQVSQSGLAYRRAGDGPAVVLLHGIPGSAASWHETAARLPDCLDVIVPDLLGFGASSRPTTLPQLHLEAQAAALAALLDELAVRHATVVGHDFGAPVAVTLVGRRAELVASLGVLAGNVFANAPIPFPLAAVTWPMVSQPAARLLFSRSSLTMMLRLGTGNPPVGLDREAHLGDRGQQRSIATIFRGSLRRLGELYAPVEAVLPRVNVPTLVAWGDRDPFFPLSHGQRSARALGTELRVHAGAGHFLPQERPGQVARDVAALASVAARR
jgi:pimeloyl-ACP methyl ester carboxylesterase